MTLEEYLLPCFLRREIRGRLFVVDDFVQKKGNSHQSSMEQKGPAVIRGQKSNNVQMDQPSHSRNSSSMDQPSHSRNSSSMDQSSHSRNEVPGEDREHDVQVENDQPYDGKTKRLEMCDDLPGKDYFVDVKGIYWFGLIKSDIKAPDKYSEEDMKRILGSIIGVKSNNPM